MLRSLFAIPMVAAPRALADGSSGTLGAGTVGTYELRSGAVGLANLADMPAGRLMGRANGAAGTPEALTPAQVQTLLTDAAIDLIAFSRAEAEALSPPASARVLRILGWAEPGDGGDADFVRVYTNPGHSGAFQTADGDWWEIQGLELHPESFGAVVKDGVTDESAPFLAAMSCAMVTQRPLVISATHAIYSDLEVEETIVLSGRGAVAGLVFFNRSQLLVKKGDGSEFVQACVIENLSFADGGDKTGWSSKPLIEAWRTAFWRVSACQFDGRNRRTYGLWLGRGSTVWGSVVDNCRFVSFGVGAVMGDNGDATHNRFTSNTVDHAKICGAVFCNPHGGLIESNSFENCEGRVGLAVLSRANGGVAKAAGVSIRANYIYNNALSFHGDPDSAGILIGHDVPGTNFTSGTGAWAMDVANNYVVSSHQVWAIRANLLQGGRLAFNVVETEGTSDFDIQLSGAPETVEVQLNKNQSLPFFDRVDATDDWLTPVSSQGGDVEVDGMVEAGGDRFGFRTGSVSLSDRRGGLAYRGEAAGAAGTAATLLSLSAIDGADSAFALVSAEEPGGARRGSYVLHVCAAGGGAVSQLSGLGAADGAVFGISGGTVTMKRDNAWQGNVVAMFVGGPSAL